MRKIAIAFSTKDQIELTKQTIVPLLQPHEFDLYWCDGSVTDEGKGLTRQYSNVDVSTRVRGGADSAIAWKLSQLLAASQNYEYIGLAENDVLLDEDWLLKTMELFEIGARDGLKVGAVSPRSYVDRVLIQRDGYACMLNIGAGFVIFTREAAQIVLRSFRTGWWPSTRLLFAQLAGIDVATYAAFRGQEQFTTTDWQFETQLASHGLASLALTPAKCQMLGQVPPLKEQGLELVESSDWVRRDDKAFDVYRNNLCLIGEGKMKIDLPGILHRDGNGQLFFAHQIPMLQGSRIEGPWKLNWNQAFGPFAYRAGEGGASLSLPISGTCSLLVSGGADGGKVTVEDTRSGFKFSPEIPPQGGNPMSIEVPGGPVRREIAVRFDEGTVFHGVSTADQQLIDPTFSFDWSQLPGVD